MYINPVPHVTASTVKRIWKSVNLSIFDGMMLIGCRWSSVFGESETLWIRWVGERGSGELEGRRADMAGGGFGVFGAGGERLVACLRGVVGDGSNDDRAKGHRDPCPKRKN